MSLANLISRMALISLLAFSVMACEDNNAEEVGETIVFYAVGGGAKSIGELRTERQFPVTLMGYCAYGICHQASLPAQCVPRKVSLRNVTGINREATSFPFPSRLGVA